MNAPQLRTALALVALSAAVAGLALAAPQATKKPAAEPQPTKGEKPAADTAKSVEAPLRELLGAFTKGYNAGSAEALTPLFAEDGALIDNDGNEIRGRKAISEHYQDSFADGPVAQLQGAVEAVHFLAPTVATINGSFQLLDDAQQPVSSGHYRVIAVQRGSQWLLAELHDDVVVGEEPSHEDHLQELAWMVGDWVDESQDVRIDARVRWSDNHNFLVRTYNMQRSGQPAVSGTQWIGWDPRAGQIKSWVFDSSGGHGEGFWARQGNEWIVKAFGTLNDGRATSATQIIEPISKGAIKLRSLDRMSGGEMLPAMDEIIMVRKPPQPSEESAETKAE